ncbi:hypothetical protein HRW18_38095 [Streptomyces lunaelactis]|uniref:hypothetical protein n=1 Tax=Streptomyces lunaelactis TaxID=1535768 RepID=UPI001584586F|nr:hypothetical protein [Streptomyces lunaelactis]NUK13651.1 hypothetical protein [Streptomyces lunaelactis]NUL14158.1 hypothetical protein [Streptomyces lunaelactis]NUL26958.1 hypothetical protein [Streptomyces lunaelactis]
MVTAWSSSRMSRARSSAGPLRMLWVAMMLFAFVYAHGVSAEGVIGHLDASATVHTAAAIDGHAVEDVPVDHHGGGHGPSHPAQECVTGQPQQTPALDAPSACALVEEGISPSGPPAAVAFGDVASAKQLPSTSIRATVLQV